MAAADISIGASSYLNRYSRGVDPSHRLLLPIEWRTKGAPARFTVLLWPIQSPQFLLALPPAGWEDFCLQLRAIPQSQQDRADLERLLSLHAFFCALDRFGRLPLPEQAINKAAINDKAELIGRTNKFEIWNPARLSTALNKPDVKRLAETLEQINV
jgi:division/cell wall cluster transcriptional repressor MraZ